MDQVIFVKFLQLKQLMMSDKVESTTHPQWRIVFYIQQIWGLGLGVLLAPPTKSTLATDKWFKVGSLHHLPILPLPTSTTALVVSLDAMLKLPGRRRCIALKW